MQVAGARWTAAGYGVECSKKIRVRCKFCISIIMQSSVMRLWNIWEVSRLRNRVKV